MIKGLYAAASAMLANLSRQGALSHNIANLDTPGFKQIMVSLDDFIHTPVIYPPVGAKALQWIGNLGLGVEATPEETDFTPGALQDTGQALDLALVDTAEGYGFFRLQTPNGEAYTRDGRFSRDIEGNLVTVEGYAVLDQNGQPINIPEGLVSITSDGVILVDGEASAQMGLASFTDPSTDLVRDLPNTFVALDAAAGDQGLADGNSPQVIQGFLEMANANAAQLTTQMVAVTRAYEAAQQMVQTQDELLGRTISSLGSF